jgi:hypothetical protein
MEQINSIRSGPYIGTFVEANGIGNKVLISASFPTDNYIGLWIRRVIEDTDMDPFSCDTLYNNYIAGTPLTTEVAPTINVEWT